MKICLKCRKIYGTDLQFCTADGSRLVNGDFCERNTARLFIGGANCNEPSSPTMAIPMSPRHSSEPANKSKLNSRLALIGLLAVIILLSGSFVWAAIRIVAANRTAETVSIPNTSPTAAPQAETGETPKPQDVKDIGRRMERDETKVANVKKLEANTAAKTPKRNQFNGRVIMLNAVLRAAPTMESGVQETLQLDEPVKIGKRAAPNSPWFRVLSASGAKGWMHGSTIEFVD